MQNKATEILMVSVDAIAPNPKNNNKHTAEQKERAHKIFDYQGFRNPLTISKRSGLLVAGHLRLEVAKEKGIKELPCMYQDFESEEQEYAHMTADNALAAWAELDLAKINQDFLDLGPDLNVDWLGIKDFVIEPLDKLEPQCDEDEVPEHVEPKTKRGDIYKLGNHRLMCGDSTMIDDVEKLMNGEKADMVFTDPPYNIASDSKNYVGEIRPDSYGKLKNAEWDKNFDINAPLANAMAVCEDSVTLYVWTSQFLIQKIWDNLNEWCDFTCYLVWSKTNPMPSLSKRHPTWNTELCVYATRGTKRVVNFPIGENFLSCRTISQKTNDRLHPTQKPIELIQPLIEFSSGANQKILDPFGGSGSTLIACEKTNRKCFMMELDAHYCDVIVARWEKYTGKKAELLT